MNTRFLRRTSIRTIGYTLIATLCALSLPVGQVHAALIGTDVVMSAAQAGQNRAHVNGFLQRKDVRALLQTRGLDADAALQRVNAMTDAEVQSLADRIDNLPAGGSDVLGVVFTVFVILLITDILGLTKVFPFTRPIR
jgi:hypothetical protein